MQANTKQYANALYVVTKDASANEVDAIVTRFLALLKAENAQHLSGSVLREYRTLLIKRNELPEVTIKTPTVLSSQIITMILEQLNIGVQNVVKQDVDERIIGGVVIKRNNQLFDLSLKRRLVRLADVLR